VLSRIIAKKYARALLGVGLNDRNYEALGQDLDKMADLLGESRDLRVVLRSPAFPKSARKTIARKVGERLGLTTTTVTFIEFLIHRRRMDHFFLITKTYRDLCDEVAGRTRVTLAIPLELPSNLVREIKSLTASMTGKEVILSLEKDPSLIGGVLMKIGSVVYDGSLRSQMAKLKDTLCRD
jgi:F-type H+-transporting ATPase subunit delta